MKKILIFIGILLPWFFSSLFQSNLEFYKSLYLPVFAPPGTVFSIVWTILYILIAISIYMITTDYKFKEAKSYYYSLIINYLFNQSFIILFFKLESPFLGLVATIGSFISALFLYYETKQLNKKASYFLIPYLLWLLFASILAFSIYFMNL